MKESIEEVIIIREKSTEEMTSSTALIIYNLFPIEMQSSSIQIEMLFERDATNRTMQRTGRAATDTLVKDSSIGGC